MDTMTEDEEELGPNKKRGRGNAIMFSSFVYMYAHTHMCKHLGSSWIPIKQILKVSIFPVDFLKEKQKTHPDMILMGS